MLVTLSYFRGVYIDDNNIRLPIGRGKVGGQSMAAAGNATAAPAETALVCVRTDTAITVNAYGTGVELVMPGQEGWFPCAKDQVLAIAAA